MSRVSGLKFKIRLHLWAILGPDFNRDLVAVPEAAAKVDSSTQKVIHLKVYHWPKSQLHEPGDLVSQKVFVKSFFRSQHPHKSVNLSFTTTNKRVSWRLGVGIDFFLNDFTNTFGEIRPES